MSLFLEESVTHSLQSFGFFVTAAVLLVFLSGDKVEDEENQDYLEDLLPSSGSFTETYSFLLKDLKNNAGIVSERMPTFNEMMYRRCFSADDIRALDLISDRRLQSSFDLAFERARSPVLSEGTAETEFTCGTAGSWDVMA